MRNIFGLVKGHPYNSFEITPSFEPYALFKLTSPERYH